MNSSEFPNEVASLCYEHFKNLPKKGKPQTYKEWTLLASIVMSNEYPKSLKVVSLTTGTKCLGFSQLTDRGDIMFDSHAEVLARRSFIKFLMHHMLLLLHKKESEILTYNEMEKKFTLKSGIAFHLFVSHVPCGDAAIFPKNLVVEENTAKEQLQNDSEEIPSKKLKLGIVHEPANPKTKFSNASEDIYRTGAKCIDGDAQDPKMPGKNFHVTGALRTKPGRGDPTWSMSCSDKIALWNISGIQGALLSILLATPVYLSSIIFGKCPFDAKAIERAVVERISGATSLPPQYCINKPFIAQSKLMFEYSKENTMMVNSAVVPCPASIIWCDIPGFLEVSVNGRKQGITKKNINKPTSRVSICKSMLFEDFQEIISMISENSDEMPIKIKDNPTYFDCKQMAKSYQEAKNAVWKIFSKWKRKPDHLQKFTVLKNKINKLF